MSDTDETIHRQDDGSRQEGELVGRLLRLAGPRPEVPAEATQRVKDAVRTRWRRAVSARRRRRGLLWLAGGLGAAASVFLLLRPEPGGGPSSPQEPRSPAGQVVLASGRVLATGGSILVAGDRIQSGTVLETASGSRAALRLAGGATVRLDVETRLRLETASLLELEHGAIYIESPEDSGSEGGVAIRTSAGIVREIGTRFEVRVEEARLRVRVREGEVGVDGAQVVHRVSAGQQLTIDPNGARKTTVPLHGPEWDWVLEVAPPFVLEGRTLEEFLAWVSHETGLKVRFSTAVADLDPAGIVLHGSIAGMRPDQAPGAVLPTCGLRHDVSGDTLRILPAESVRSLP